MPYQRNPEFLSGEGINNGHWRPSQDKPLAVATVVHAECGTTIDNGSLSTPPDAAEERHSSSDRTKKAFKIMANNCSPLSDNDRVRIEDGCRDDNRQIRIDSSSELRLVRDDAPPRNHTQDVSGEDRCGTSIDRQSGIADEYGDDFEEFDSDNAGSIATSQSRGGSQFEEDFDVESETHSVNGSDK